MRLCCKLFCLPQFSIKRINKGKKILSFNDNNLFILAVSIFGKKDKFEVQSDYPQATLYEQNSQTSHFSCSCCTVYEETWTGKLYSSSGRHYY